MFSRLHEAGPEGRDRGFAATGLALVAATVVVALAVTAVAFSLKEKEDDSSVARETIAERNEAGYTSQAMSGVKNAATAMESWGVANRGEYTGACGGAASTSCAAFDDTATAGPSNRLVDQGLKLPQGVNVTVVRADAVGYCLLATHDKLPGYEVYFASAVGVPETEPCT